MMIDVYSSKTQTALPLTLDPHRCQVLHSRVIGQNEAVTAVAKAVRRARAGLSLGSIGRFELSVDLGC